ncbi:MAG: hypothetical protein IBJ00_07930 [Alphaproteobacteria bacterium]|nr:hypothetical protein [Alphaproteobacteria bacterium]
MVKFLIKIIFWSVISFSAYASDFENFDPELNLSLKAFLVKYPLKETVFYDLEEKLYTFPTTTEAEVLYNSDLTKLKRGIKNLKALSKGNKSLAKTNAIKHLFVLAESMREGKNGIVQDEQRGIKLLRFCLDKGYKIDEQEYSLPLRNLELRKQEYNLERMIQDIKHNLNVKTNTSTRNCRLFPMFLG